MRHSAFISLLVTAVLSVIGLYDAAAAPVAGDDVSFRYRSGKTSVEPAVKPNADNLAKLDAILSGPQASHITRIELRAASSPNGPTYLNKHYAHARAQEVMDYVSSKYPSLPASVWQVEEVAEDWDGVISYLRRSKKDYKEEALQIVRGGAANREELLHDLYTGEAWDDLVNYCFPYLRTVKLHIVYDGEPEAGQVQPTDQTQKTEITPGETDEGLIVVPRVEHSLLFARGSNALNLSYLDNAAQWEKIRELVTDLGTDSLLVESFASPEGTVSGNQALSRRRAESFKQMLSRQLGIPASQISIRPMGEDWDGFARNVRENYQGEDRDDVLRILGSSLSEETKKFALRRLDGGKTWQHLIDNEMKSLRRISVRRFSTDETIQWVPGSGMRVVREIEPLPDLAPVTSALMSRSPDLASSAGASGILSRPASAASQPRGSSSRLRI